MWDKEDEYYQRDYKFISFLYYERPKQAPRSSLISSIPQ